MRELREERVKFLIGKDEGGGFLDFTLCHDSWTFDELLNRFPPRHGAKCASAHMVDVTERGADKAPLYQQHSDEFCT